MNFKTTRGNRALRTAAIFVAATTALTACASENTVDSDNTKSITIYSGRSEEIIAPLLEKFTAETGVSVTVRYGDSAELAAQILEEGENTKADVFFSQDAGALGALGEAGVLTQLPATTTSLVPAKYRSTTDTWVGVSGRSRVLSYNPAAVTTVPTSVLEFVKPEWKGRIGIAPTNASFQAFVTAFRILKGEAAAKEFLIGLKANAVTFEKNSQILDAVESGQIDAGLINHYYWYEKAAEIGADKMTSKIAWFADGDVGNLVNVAGVGVLKSGDNANTFAAWLLSDTAQRFFVETTYEYSLTGSVPAAGNLPELESIAGPDINLEELSSLSQTLSLLSEVGLT